ncbi:MAG: DoxX family protein [Chitinophagaceae bacterium]|nr:MAG: DoxX family protein [Chitinophagaceae bacterium]
MSQHRLACIVFAIITGAFGIFHLFNAKNMESKVPDFIPGGIIWIYISGIAFVLASIAILVNYHTKLACYLLGVMLFIFVLVVHVPIIVTGETEEIKQTALIMMLKDVGLIMAAFLVGYNSDRPDTEPNL